MEEPITQPQPVATNGEQGKSDSMLETASENSVCHDEAPQVATSKSSVDAADDHPLEENKFTAGAVTLAVEKLAPLTDDTRASVEEHAEVDSQQSEPQKAEQVCPSGSLAAEEAPSAKSDKRLIECGKCHANESLFWRTSATGELICVECQGATELEAKEEGDEELSQVGSDPPTTPSGSDHNEDAEDLADQDDAPPKAPSPRKRELRKATRLKTAKYVKSAIKNRRSLTFKKSAPSKTTPSVSHFITSNYVRHKGSYLQRGDIVSMLGDDSEIYYAQLRTFLVDQFGQLSATISWLIPTERSPADGSFDPATFVLGPEEDFPRDLRSMSFECHAPSDYYLARDKPILFDEKKGCKAFVWSTLGRPKAIQEAADAQ